MVTASRSRKNRGACSRASTFLRAIVSVVELPTRVSGIVPTATIRQVVKESGYFIETVVLPVASVLIVGDQNMLSRKSALMAGISMSCLALVSSLAKLF